MKSGASAAHIFTLVSGKFGKSLLQTVSPCIGNLPHALKSPSTSRGLVNQSQSYLKVDKHNLLSQAAL